MSFYTQTHFIHSVGITDLNSYFVDKSIYVQSLKQYDQRALRGVYILAHLLEIVDTVQISDQYIYHPGDKVTISGYFLDNSSNPSKVRLKFASPDELETCLTCTYSEVCLITSATVITCKVQPDHSLYGDLLVNLVEEVDLVTHNTISLSDESYLSMIILPKPSVQVLTNQIAYVTAQSKAGEGVLHDIRLRLTFESIGSDDSFFIDHFRHLFADQTMCKLVSETTVFETKKTNTTWFNANELNCHIGGRIHVEDALSCI